MKLTCKQCGKEFELSQSEIDFYNSKNLHIPKRCQECRHANKQKNGSCDHNYRNSDIQNRYQKQSNGDRTISNKLSYAILIVVVFLTVGGIALNHIDFTDENVGIEKPQHVENVYIPETIHGGTDTVHDTAEDDQDETETFHETVRDENEDSDGQEQENVRVTPQYVFRNSKLLNEHFMKHGMEMGFATEEEYQAAASAVVTNENSLHKIEAEDGDDVYYLETSNDFVIVSTDGYLRTYFRPNDGIAYFNRQ